MAAPVCQFVDRVGTGAIQRLNLNDGKNLQLLMGPEHPNPDFSPPLLKRAVVNTLLAEGAYYPASAYDNRVIRLPLRVTACSPEEMATVLESLHRELDRANNILKWHPTYNSRPVYFRTFRSPDYRLDQTMEGRGELRTTLAILAEPFAYGDYIEQTGTIYSDPAAGVNGIHFEIAAVEGDVATPLYLRFDSMLLAVGDAIVLGARRHGTSALYFEQAEAMALGFDTTLQANDALMSGAGQNFVRTDFVGAPTMVLRLTWDPAPGAGGVVDYRGTYRAFARVRRQNAIDDINIQMAYGAATNRNAAVKTLKQTEIQLVDLGLVSIPYGKDPVYDGYTGIFLPVDNIPLYFEAEREAGGAGYLDWDYVVLVPADEGFAIGSVWGYNNIVFDGPNDLVFHYDGTMVLSGVPTIVGSIPLVAPDQTNLYVVLIGIIVNVLANTPTFVARYWPRHLYIR